jgi:hypothetical protein
MPDRMETVMKRQVRLRWTPSEKRVVDRFARAAAEWRYATIWDAVFACQRALNRLKNPVERKATTIRRKMTDRSRRLGLPRRRPRVLGKEDRVIDRFAAAVKRGEFPSATAAIPACRQALADAGVECARSDMAMLLLLSRRARDMGRISRWKRWHPAEVRLIERYARAVVSGKFGNPHRAGRAAWEELVKLRERTPELKQNYPVRQMATVVRRVGKRVARMPGRSRRS